MRSTGEGDSGSWTELQVNISKISSFILLFHQQADNIKLQEGKTATLTNRDEFKFLQDRFHYQVLIPSVKKSEEVKEGNQTPEKDIRREDEGVDKEDSNIVITPKPTGLKTDVKKRKLPDWMTASGSGASPVMEKKIKKTNVGEAEKVLSAKKQEDCSSQSKTDAYLENVKFVNPVLREDYCSSSRETHLPKHSEPLKGSSKHENAETSKKNPFIEEEESVEKMSDVDEEESENLLESMGESTSLLAENNSNDTQNSRDPSHEQVGCHIMVV